MPKAYEIREFLLLVGPTPNFGNRCLTETLGTGKKSLLTNFKDPRRDSLVRYLVHVQVHHQTPLLRNTQ